MPQSNLVQLMLDSGAFSAWNQKQTIDIKKYIKYVKANEKYLFSHVNLDVLPFGAESRRTHEAVEQCAKDSYRNLQVMKDAGLTPLPVFHHGESYRWLDKMLEDGETYIGLSTRKDVWASQQANFLDACWKRITDAKGRPLVRAHGFGVTNPALIFRYPWHTVDSTTWTLTPGYGQIIIPRLVGKKFDWARPGIRIVISGRQHQAKTNQKRQYEGFIYGDQKNYQYAIDKFLLEEVGIKDVAQIRYGTSFRRKAVLIYYMRLVEHHTHPLFNRRKARSSLLDIGPLKPQLGKPSKHDFKIMFATNLSKEWSYLMNEARAYTRLLSYWELMKTPPEVLGQYVTTGTSGEYKRKVPKGDWNNETYRNFRLMSLAERAQRVE